MSLPLPVSSSVTPQGSRTLRPGASAKPTAPASLRTHGALRSGAAPAARTTKGKTGFASVLAAVQQDDAESSVTGRQAVASTQGRASKVDNDAELPRSGVDSRTSRAAAAPGDAATVAQSQPTPQAPPTPWLLLALGNGSHSWQEPGGGEGEVDDAGSATDQPAARREGDHAPVAVAVQAAVVAVPEAPPSPAAVEAVTSGSVGAGERLTAELPPPAVFVTGAAVAGPPATPGVTDVSDGPGGSDGAARTADQVLRSGHADDAPRSEAAVAGRSHDELVTPGRPADAEGRGVERNGEVGSRANDRAEIGGGAHAAPNAPQAAAHAPDAQRQAASRPTGRAAQWLGQAVRTSAPISVTVEPASPGIDVQPAGTPTAMPPRASEALLRLAQASDDAPVRRGGGQATVPSVPFAPAALIAPPMAEVTAPVAQVPLPAAVGEQVLHQVVSSLRMQWKDGIGEARLQLRPDALGAVSVSLRVEAGAVTAVVRAESAQVQEWVVQNQETLRQQMEAAGLHLGELVVTPDDQGPPQRHAPQEQRRRRPAAPGASTTFETLL